MSGLKRHLEWYTQREQPLKDRTRFWTWNMRGLHGDMDTRYEGDKSTTVRNTARTVTTAPDANGFNFRPLASNTYGYHPKSVTTRCNPGAGLAAVAGLQAERAAEKAANEPPAYLQNNRPDWSAPMKSLDDVMLMREPGAARSSTLPRRSPRMPIDPALDDLLTPRRPAILRRGLANRLWRPSLFWDDDALLKPSHWINDPWWHKYPELRPLDLAVSPSQRAPSGLRKSYLSPIKRTYIWGYHPLRPNGYYY